MAALGTKLSSGTKGQRSGMGPGAVDLILESEAQKQTYKTLSNQVGVVRISSGGGPGLTPNLF